MDQALGLLRKLSNADFIAHKGEGDVGREAIVASMETVLEVVTYASTLEKKKTKGLPTCCFA